MSRVDGLIAMVTGGAKGIGKATAEMLAADGAQVAVTDVDAQAGTETVNSIANAGGETAFFEHDVAAEGNWERVGAATQDTFGAPDDATYAMVYLTSEESKFVTGTEPVLDGDFTAQ